ncbi:MAG: trypsin-like peptidase domain-containing protein [Chloroflexi bacterium]|nr:trypsin-like peptidase domain-containing protein [Chloroflexota bacterium]
MRRIIAIGVGLSALAAVTCSAPDPILVDPPVPNAQATAIAAAESIQNARAISLTPTVSIVLGPTVSPLDRVPTESAESLVALADRVRPSIVRIDVERSDGPGIGTGFAYTGQLILTNAHVIANATSVRVTVSSAEGADARTYDAEILGLDTINDLAVLRASEATFQSLSFGTSSDAAVSDTVIAIGYTSGTGGAFSVTQGIVSRKLDVGLTLIQHDAAIPAGSSGGPLFTPDGVVVGINTAELVEVGVDGGRTLSFAIAAEEAFDRLATLELGTPAGSTDPLVAQPSATPWPTVNPGPLPTPTPIVVPTVIAPPTPTSTPDASILLIPTPRPAPTLTPTPPALAITAAYTGFYLDLVDGAQVRRTNNRNSIEIKFNLAVDPNSVQNTDFEVKSTVAQTPTFVTVGGPGFEDRVFLTLFTELETDEAPTVWVVGSIVPAEGFAFASGIAPVVAQDALPPTIAVTLSAGSSTTQPSSVTNDKITFFVTSDELLSGNPVIEIYDETNSDELEGTVSTSSLGGNQWIGTLDGTLFDGSTRDGKIKSVRVIADDLSNLTDSNGVIAGNTLIPVGEAAGRAVLGTRDFSAAGSIVFSLDKTAPTLSLSPSGSTSDKNPLVEWDFGEVVSISSLQFGLASGPLQNFTGLAGSFDGRVHFFPMSGLSPGTQRTIVSATDLAGNAANDVRAEFVVVP